MSLLIQRTFFLLLFLGVSLFLTGCGEKELYSNLSEKEANEMIAILIRNAIKANKLSGAENTYIVNVETQYFSEAVDILNNYGYPHDKFVGVGDVFKKSGLVSSPSEERIRYMHALSQDLQNTLCLISGVLNARVHIVIPNNDPLADQVYPASAAVFIKYRKNAGVEALSAQVKNLVVKSIEGLNYDNVTLALFPVDENDTTAPAGEQPIIDPQRLKTSPLPFILAGITFVLVAIGSAVAYIMLYRKKKLKKDSE